MDVDKLNEFLTESTQILNNNPILSMIVESIIKKNKNKTADNETDNETFIMEDKAVKMEDKAVKMEDKAAKMEDKAAKMDDEVINTITLIDKYIDSFSIDELLTKPTFILNFDDDNIKDYMEEKEKMLHISDNKTNGLTDTNRDILKTVAKSASDNTEFAQKKNFYDIITNKLNSDLVFNDKTPTQTTIFKYQYLINTFFNKKIDQFKDKFSLEKDDIVFIYKGGTYMKIMYEKYKNLLNDNLQKMFNDAMTRSDSDYAVLINKYKDKFNTRKLYTPWYYKLNILIYNILNKIQLFISNNLNIILPIQNITETNLSDIIIEMNKRLNDKKKLGLMNFYKDVKEIIGLGIAEKTYFTEKLPDNFDFYILDSSATTSSFESKDIDYFKKNKRINVDRDNFYVTPIKKNDGFFSKIIKIPGSREKNGIFQYYNETNRFVNDDKLTYFCLHRLKLNTIVYFKTTDGKYGFFKSPGELVDIPISTFDDAKTYIDISKNIKSYIYKYDTKALVYNSYTLFGIIEDLVKNMTIDFYFPWDDIKYLKRIKRLGFFSIIYFNLMYINFDQIKGKIQEYLRDFNIDASKTSFIKYDNTTTNEDIVYDKLIHFFEIVHDRTMKSTLKPDPEGKTDKDKENSIILLFNEIANNFNQQKILNDFNNNPEEVKYLNKYLKYKQKYLDIKNKNYNKK